MKKFLVMYFTQSDFEYSGDGTRIANQEELPEPKVILVNVDERNIGGEVKAAVLEDYSEQFEKSDWEEMDPLEEYDNLQVDWFEVDKLPLYQDGRMVEFAGAMLEMAQ